MTLKGLESAFLPSGHESPKAPQNRQHIQESILGIPHLSALSWERQVGWDLSCSLGHLCPYFLLPGVTYMRGLVAVGSGHI